MDSNPPSPVPLSPSTPHSIASDASQRSPLPFDDNGSPAYNDFSPLHVIDHNDESSSPSYRSTSPTIPLPPPSNTNLDTKTTTPTTPTTASTTASTASTTAVAAKPALSAATVTSTSVGGNKGEYSAAVDLKEYDENGMRTVVDYYINEKGQYVKRTRVMRLVTKKIRVNKKVEERRKWSKIGDCAGQPPGPEPNITTKASDIIHLNTKPTFPGEEEHGCSSGSSAGAATHATFVDVLLKKEGKVVTCSNCGEAGHFSLKCPKRQHIVPPTKDNDSDYPQTDKIVSAAATSSSTSAYVPSWREEAKQNKHNGEREKDAEDGLTIRITNLSEDAQERDLWDLCGRCGFIKRLYLAKDRDTFKSRGFAFVTYKTKEEAQNAIQKLDRHLYDRLVLAVETAKPRTNTDANNNNNNNSNNHNNHHKNSNNRKSYQPLRNRK